MGILPAEGSHDFVQLTTWLAGALAEMYVHTTAGPRVHAYITLSLFAATAPCRARHPVQSHAAHAPRCACEVTTLAAR